ncbi:MAG: TIGR00730 family Rossman fold protein [Spirochaetota bacterium]
MGIKSYRNADFLESDAARDIRILTDYTYPNSEFNKQKVRDTIVLFGSARIPEKTEGEKALQKMQSSGQVSAKQIADYQKRLQLHNYYEAAQKVGYMITKWGQQVAEGSEEKRLLVCTGGGPGIMEAGNRGAREAGGQSVALNISLPHEQSANAYVSPELSFEFSYFFMRKLWFIHLAKAVIVFPGGFGTADELFETLTLLQTKKISNSIPVLLYGSEFWKKVISFEAFLEYGMISEEDLELFEYVDSPEKTLEVLQQRVIL